MKEDLTSRAWSILQIAAACRWTKRIVERKLRAVDPIRTEATNGKPSPRFSLASLPHHVAQRLASITRERRYRSMEELLSDPARRWEPQTPLARTSADAIEKARKLQAALRQALDLPGNPSTSERARVAAPSYAREFGYNVSDRHLRELIDRTLERDGEEQNFNRLEIYLDERTARIEPKARAKAAPAIFGAIDDAALAITDRTQPTPEETAYLWRKTLDCYFVEIESAAAPKRAKRAVVSYLFRAAPFLSKSLQALTRNFERKLETAREGGTCAIVDRRRESSGRRLVPPCWEQSIKSLAAWARQYGNIERAWRELHEGSGPTGERFAEAFRDCYPYEARIDKGRGMVPARVRNTIRPMLRATDAIHHGPKAARLALPSHHRDWSSVLAGASYTSDDVTQNHYIYDWCEDGEYEFSGRRFNVTRCQWLPVVDERTDYPLGFSLIPERTYNGRAIRTLLTRICNDELIGLPFTRFLFERGIWKSRHVEALASWASLDDAFARQGIALQMRHATTPKAKIIERVIGELQTMMQPLPCYIGRNERTDHFERPTAQLARLKKAGQPLKAECDPAEFLMSKEQYADRIEETLKRFAREPQTGERLDGLSPEQAWKSLSGGRVHNVLPESLRYLLGTEQSEQTVTNEGVCVKIGGRKEWYSCSARLGSCIGEKVRVRYNPEFPEHVTVCHLATDPKEARPFSVPLSPRIPAIGATAADFARHGLHRKEFASFGRSIHRVMVPSYNRTRRDELLGSEATRATGEALQAVEREHIEVRSTRARNAAVYSARATAAAEKMRELEAARETTPFEPQPDL